MISRLEMAKIYRTEIEVRGYELDSYGHVNHAVYLNYMEHARWKLLEDEGIRRSDFDRWQRWPVIARVEADYLRPTYIGQKLEIQTEIVENGRTWFACRQEIRCEESIVFRGKIRAVIVNEKGRPAEAPPEVSRLWTGDRE
jgi:YbgC/YbaW family acyl-CoA thioester hydrolase